MRLLAILKQWRKDGSISIDEYDTAVSELMELLYELQYGFKRPKGDD
jgi:hypothetical protein